MPAEASSRTCGRWCDASQRNGDVLMTAWTSDELAKIGTAEELQLASRRRDGSLRKPVTIWVVRHGDDLYVRSWRGRTAAWYRAAQVRNEGRIWAGGVEKDVTFVDAEPDINDAIDAVYRTKYHRYADSYVLPMISPDARATTLKLVARNRREVAVSVRSVGQKVADLNEQVDAYRDLSTSLALDDREPAGSAR